ncbi:MAG: GNAT family N-acetyltransferase [Chloroflexi bacterium]|nr:GNAT family N-acetyltransferase [Chloroflexota bacterium]
MNLSGYLHPLYAQSLIEFGEPLELPASKGWILKRHVPGTSQFDGMGCYPIFTCENWLHLEKDLRLLEDQLVSLSLVTDPFGDYTHQELLRCFKDVAKPYKEHYIVDLIQQPQAFVSPHHQRNAYKALQQVKVEICQNPIQFLDEWCLLYDNLIERHNIRGMTRFSRTSFAGQLIVPGMIAFRAIVGEETVGMLLWAIQNNGGYYHLGAYSSEGYKLKASFALFWTLLEYFKNNGLAWLSLGAGAGLQGDEEDGLTRFKRGWATGTRTVFFCGRIFNAEKYRESISANKTKDINYFPAYRAGEFT